MFDWLFEGIVNLVIDAVNALIAGLAAILSPLVTTLPEMPELPSMPTAFTTAYEWVAWFFPVSTVLDILAFAVAVWLLWTIVAIALRWAKALNA